ncbi:hypothetical protein [Bacteriophage sp.]|nr:hypothetical protein [Bacteriophage sp.]
MLQPSNPTNLADPYRKASPYDLTPAELGAVRQFAGGVYTAANLPLPNNVPIGRVIQRADLNYSYWYSDGTWWRPHFAALIARNTGSVATPLASMVLTGGVSQFLVTPTNPVVTIPAGLIPPQARLRVEADFVRNAAGAGTLAATIFLGNANTTSDPQLFSVSMTVANVSAWASASARLGTSRSTAVGSSVNYGGAGSQIYSDKACNFDAVSYINFGANSSGVAADTLALLSYRVWLED